MKSNDTLLEEIWNVIEYAGLRYREHDITIRNTKDPSQATLTIKNEVYPVDRAFLYGNLRRLPDNTSNTALLVAVRLSHPDTKGVGPKSMSAEILQDDAWVFKNKPL